jgi:probable HAF family extracellular repeat protein
MKSTRLTGILAMTLLVVALPGLLAAQDDTKPDQHHGHHHYQAVDMGTFGGPNSSYGQPPPTERLLNNSGAAVGGADTSTPDPLCIGFNFDCYLAYGFKWQDGITNKLDALPGFNSSMTIWVNDKGSVVGISENGIDLLTGGPALEAILWGRDGSITDLGTFGGNESVANAVNNRDVVAGVALNTISDPYTSTGIFLLPGATQAHAFRWTKFGGLQDLGTLGGPDSSAVLINERGQIAGWSFTNSIVNATTGVPTLDPFFWENGKMRDLGTLGGTFGRALALNNRGQIAGISNLAGDQKCHPFLWSRTGGMKDLGTLGGDSGFALSINDAGEVVGVADVPGALGCEVGEQSHAFLWKNGVMADLGTADGDACSFATSINSKSQIVGAGTDCSVELQALLWEDGGPAVDLNTLIPPNPDLVLFEAAYVNDQGEIAAFGALSNVDVHAFVLIPCDENHPGIGDCDYSVLDVARTDGVSPAPATQHPAALPVAGRMPAGMFNRGRLRWGQRNPGTGPAPDQKQVPAADTVSDELRADHILDPPYGGNTGYCEEQRGLLNGYCAAFDRSYGYCTAKRSTGCPAGQKAKKPGLYDCYGFHQYSVDLGTKCSYR